MNGALWQGASLSPPAGTGAPRVSVLGPRQMPGSATQLSRLSLVKQVQTSPFLQKHGHTGCRARASILHPG